MDSGDFPLRAAAYDVSLLSTSNMLLHYQLFYVDGNHFHPLTYNFLFGKIENIVIGL